MIPRPNLVLLWCLVGGFTAVLTVSPTPTTNPECLGMHHAASSLEKGFSLFYKGPAKCQVNSFCTGLSCNGTKSGDPLFMKVVLEHCHQPPQVHLDLKYPAKNVDIHRELKQGSEVKLFSHPGLTTKLKVTLKRDQNRVTASLVVEACVAQFCHPPLPLLPETTFCVNMNTCKGFNTTGYPQCPLPTPTPTPTPASKPSNPTEEHHKHSSFGPTSYITTTQMPATLGKKGHHHGDGHHHISVGLAVGIGFACLAAIGIIIGVLLYWKKFHYRSRLRAAYYNDISMNDPLYEDFGPEVA